MLWVSSMAKTEPTKKHPKRVLCGEGGLLTIGWSQVALGSRWADQEPKATVVLMAHGKEVKGESTGNGPVDASMKAIESQAKSGAEMVLYAVNAISGSTESQGEVTVRLQQ